MTLYRKLRLRLTIVCAVSTGLVVTAMAATSLHYSVAQLRLQSEKAFESSLNAVFFYLRGQSTIDHAWLAQTESANGLFIRVDVSGEQLYFTELNPLRGKLTAAAAETALAEYGFDFLRRPSGTVQPDSVTFQLQVEEGRFQAAAASVPGGDRWYSVILLRDTAQDDRQIIYLIAIFVGCVLLALACLAGVAWLFTGQAVRPVQQSRERQNEFISAASHELRSPLAVIKAAAGTIRQAPPARVERFSGLIERECDRLSRLTDDLLALAGADSGHMAIAFSSVEPETLILSVSEGYESLAVEKGIRLRTKLPAAPLPPLFCDRQRVEQALSILLDNAIRHTPQNGAIGCEVYRSHKSVCFSVADSGPGVPDSEKEKIFERFYRGDAARTQKAHYGLGLSIAREIAELHRGTLSVCDNAGGGAQFVFSLPAK